MNSDFAKSAARALLHRQLTLLASRWDAAGGQFPFTIEEARGRIDRIRETLDEIDRLGIPPKSEV